MATSLPLIWYTIVIAFFGKSPFYVGVGPLWRRSREKVEYVI